MQRALTVTDFTRTLQEVLSRSLGQVLVEGEISQFTAHRSGHWYFTVKDPGAALSCVMFRGDNRYQRWTPQVGEQVTLTGAIDVYPPQGRYSLLVRRIERAGAGDLAQRLEALKQKLAAEGLFDPARKRPLPRLPRAIGVATSPTGAAFQDILRVLERRFPSLPVYLAPCRVQGAAAASEIVAAMELLVRHGRSDAIIVGRGGGSPEDLFCFNDEQLARAIARCPVPVISAVGHETDVSVSDLVADVRAATPSHAAELVVPDRDGLRIQLDELDARLQGAMMRVVGGRRQALARLRVRHPGERVERARVRCEELGQRLQAAAERDIRRRRQALAQPGARLSALSPTAVLSRGYAVVFHEGRAVRGADELGPGELITVRLHRGQVRATVD